MEIDKIFKAPGNKIQYFFFINEILLIIIAIFLLTVIPYWILIKSSYIANGSEYLVEQYLMWAYGSIDNLESIDDIEKSQLFKMIFIISGIAGGFPVIMLYAFSIISVFRKFSFKDYSIKRTNHLSDDVGFAITFCVLNLLYSVSLQMFFDDLWYKLGLIYIIQPLILHLLFKNKAYSYSIGKRPRPLKT